MQRKEGQGQEKKLTREAEKLHSESLRSSLGPGVLTEG